MEFDAGNSSRYVTAIDEFYSASPRKHNGKSSFHTEELCKLAEWSVRRRAAVEAHISHTLLRAQADAIAYALRKADSRKRRIDCIGRAAPSSRENKFDSLSTETGCNVPEGRSEETLVKVEACGPRKKSSLAKGTCIAKATFEEVTRQLEKSSAEQRSYRADVSGFLLPLSLALRF
jgi:hypothetical protein